MPTGTPKRRWGQRHGPWQLIAIRRDQRVRRIVNHLRSVAPHLDSRAFSPVVQGFARISLLVHDAYETMRDKGLLDEKGELRKSVDTLRQLLQAQSAMAERLGLTPISYRSLANEKLVDIAPDGIEGQPERASVPPEGTNEG